MGRERTLQPESAQAQSGGYTAGWYDYQRSLVCLKSWGADGDMEIERIPFCWYLYVRAADYEEVNCRDLDRMLDRVEPCDDGVHVRCYLESRKREDREALVEWFRDRGIEPLEGDVDPFSRYMADNPVRFARPRILFYDVETDPRKGFVVGKHGMEPHPNSRILSLAWAGPDGKVDVEVADAYTDAAEARVLTTFLEAVADADVLVAWNGDAFDEILLRARCKALRRAMGFEPEWRLVNFLDMMLLFKHPYYGFGRDPEATGVKTSYSLDNIARTVLGETKLEGFPGAKMYDLWKKDRGRVAEYNAQDVRLMAKLEMTKGYIAGFEIICHTCNRFVSSRGLHAGYTGDGFMLRYGAARGFRFRTKHNASEKDDAEQFEGAVIFEPKPGLHRDVCAVDFSALYPSILRTFNISPETKVVGARVASPGAAPCAQAMNGACFKTDKDGILSSVVATCTNNRKPWKRKAGALKLMGKEDGPEYAEAVRMGNSWKVVQNSLVGLLGSAYTRIYDRDCFEAVTVTGQAIIKRVAALAEERGLPVLYADSIAGDVPVVVRAPDGRVIVRRVDWVWEQTQRRVVDADGKEHGALDGWGALVRGGWAPIASVIRHATSKPIIETWGNRGWVATTEDHGIVVGDRVLSPSEMSAGKIAFERTAVEPQPVSETVDIFGEIDSFFQRTVSAKRTIVRRFRPCVGDARHVACYGYGVPRVRFNRDYRRGSAELHALLIAIGAYVSAGSASTRSTSTRHLLSFAQNNRAWLDKVRAAVRTFAHGVSTSHPFQTGNMWVLRYGDTAVSLFFSALCGSGSANKRLPAFVFNLDRADFEVLWKIMLEGDGYISNARGRVINYTTISPELAAQVCVLLGMHQIAHSVCYRPAKRAWTIRVRFTPERKTRRVGSMVRPAGRSVVYDLSVAGCHQFSGGVGQVLLHNTDSNYLRCSEQQAREFMAHVAAEMDKWAVGRGGKPGFIRLDLDAQYDRIFWSRKADGTPAKKRYAGRKTTGKVDIKGLEIMRGDGCRYRREFQREVINYILFDDDPQPGTVETMCKRHAAAIYSGKLAAADLTITVGLNKLPDEYKTETPQVCVARKMLAARREVFVGMKIPYIVVGLLAPASKGKAAKPDVVHADDYQGVYDADYYWRDQCYPAVHRILTSVFPDADATWKALEKWRPEDDGQSSIFEQATGRHVLSKLMLQLEEQDAGRLGELAETMKRVAAAAAKAAPCAAQVPVWLLMPDGTELDTRIASCGPRAMVAAVEGLLKHRAYYGVDCDLGAR